MHITYNKKSLNVLILKILQEYSDYEHRLTQQDIIKILKREHEIECDRRSVKSNISSLLELEYNIVYDNGYYLAERDFEDSELRMLIDSVLFSRNIPDHHANELIKKLQQKGNKYFNAKVSHISSVHDLQHTDNRVVLYGLNTINDAISGKRKISFIYNKYGMDKALHPKREERYIVNPYQMVANNGRYYLIGNYDKYDNISHYRIDKMTDVKMLDEPVKDIRLVEGLENGLNLPKHLAEHIYMFSGESVRVKLRIPEFMMDEMVDWFGKEFRIMKTSAEGMMGVTVNCNENAMFYWALQYGPYVEVLEPISLREKIKNAVEGMAEKYKNR